MVKKKVKARIKTIDILIQNYIPQAIYRHFSLFAMKKDMDLEMLKFEKKILENLLK
jgi:hypothetical protein